MNKSQIFRIRTSNIQLNDIRFINGAIKPIGYDSKKDSRGNYIPIYADETGGAAICGHYRYIHDLKKDSYIISNCYFINNNAVHSSAIFFRYEEGPSNYLKRLKIINCTFINNKDRYISSRGCGVAGEYTRDDSLINCFFINNTKPKDNLNNKDISEIKDTSVNNYVSNYIKSPESKNNGSNTQLESISVDKKILVKNNDYNNYLNSYSSEYLAPNKFNDYELILVGDGYVEGYLRNNKFYLRDYSYDEYFPLDTAPTTFYVRNSNGDTLRMTKFQKENSGEYDYFTENLGYLSYTIPRGGNTGDYGNIFSDKIYTTLTDENILRKSSNGESYLTDYYYEINPTCWYQSHMYNPYINVLFNCSKVELNKNGYIIIEVVNSIEGTMRLELNNDIYYSSSPFKQSNGNLLYNISVKWGSEGIYDVKIFFEPKFSTQSINFYSSAQYDYKINLTKKDQIIIPNDNTHKMNNKIKSYLSGDNLEMYFKNGKYSVMLTDENKNPLSNQQIIFNLNGEKYYRTTNNQGLAYFTINLNSGIYTISSIFDGTDKYERSNNVKNTINVLQTIKSKDFSKIYKNGTQYYATFKDSNGNVLKNTDVTFNINGVFYTRTTNNQGVAKMNINLNPGTYILTATNPSNGENIATTIKVLPSIITHDLTKYYKNASKLTFRLLDNQGRPVGAGVSATININGVFYTRSTDANGYVNMNINLNPATYIATIEYNGLMVSCKVKVLPILQAKDVNMRFKDGTKFEVKLLDRQGKPFAGQKITFNINGVFYDRTTDVNGVARLNINLMAGQYIITSMYSNGAATSNKVTIKS